VHADNGSDFKGEALRRGCEDYGIRIEFRPPGRAHFGGHIERLIGTLMQRVHTLPGTTYSNPVERGDYRSEKAACLTLQELEYWLALEICVHYHGAIHRTLGTSPLVAWERAVQRGIRQWLPQDPRRFYIGFLPVEDRTLQRTGVQLENIRYWSDALPAIARFKDTVSVRYDPRNMSRIHVRGSQSLMRKTDGITAQVCAIIAQSAELAIVNGSESIDLGLLQHVSERQHLQPH
jgi:putative transposase